MFGYVLLNREDATKEEKQKYKEYYCGLCQALHKIASFKGEQLLSYDITFLYLLLSDLYNAEEEKGHVHCTIHPVGGRDTITTSMAEYCADMQLLLSMFTAQDSVDDEGSSKGRKFLEKYSRELAALKEKYPWHIREAEAALEEQKRLEAEGCEDLMALCRPSSMILATVFAPYEDNWHDRLAALGASIGRFIYILDAFDDVDKDRKKGAFNPLEKLSAEPDFKDRVEELLTWAAADAAQLLEALPLDENLSILRNIIYSGIWTRFFIKANRKKR